jgi:hypothetical protein
MIPGVKGKEKDDVKLVIHEHQRRFWKPEVRSRPQLGGSTLVVSPFSGLVSSNGKLNFNLCNSVFVTILDIRQCAMRDASLRERGGGLVVSTRFTLLFCLQFVIE